MPAFICRSREDMSSITSATNLTLARSRPLANSSKRWLYVLWLVVIAGFAVLHALNLRADFPNHSPWLSDWAKYTDEGWYGSAAIRAHLFGNWYLPGDLNTAVAVPVWPFIEWILFFFTGVTVEAARGLAVAFLFTNLLLSYLLLRGRGPRWMALLALTFMVTSPFLYCFSRLAILEPLLTTLTLVALNLAVRLHSFCRPGLLGDFLYYFVVNKYAKPPQFYWPLVSFWWSFHGGLWVDHILVPLAGLVVVAAMAARWRSRVHKLLLDPVFGASIGIIAGCIFFMTLQNHPQPRFFAVAAVFCFFVVAQGTGALLAPADQGSGANPLRPQSRLFGFAVLGLGILAACINGYWTLNYSAHPEYTFVNAAQRLAHYMDQHPNGKRLLLSISGDQLTLLAHVPSVCDDYGTQELVAKLAAYQPGWYATWNDIDPGALEDLHNHYSLEQVASFRALDHPERNMLVLFKLHSLPPGQFRDPAVENLQVPLAGDQIGIPIE